MCQCAARLIIYLFRPNILKTCSIQYIANIYIINRCIFTSNSNVSYNFCSKRSLSWNNSVDCAFSNLLAAIVQSIFFFVTHVMSFYIYPKSDPRRTLLPAIVIITIRITTSLYQLFSKLAYILNMEYMRTYIMRVKSPE